VAILKGDEMHPNPSADTVIKENDVLLVLGTSEQLQRASVLIERIDEKRKLKDLENRENEA
jgi:K+/H+ antiporter YhaU regulatory subunit KhtT